MPETLAHSVVNTNLGIRPDETVTICTWQHTITLASDIAFECRKVGAFPVILLETDELLQKILTDLPSSSLRIAPRQMLRMLDHTDVCISLQGPEDPMIYRSVEASRMGAFMISAQQRDDVIRDRKIRSADLMIGQVTEKRASVYGFDYLNWKERVERASKVDYAKMARIGKMLAGRLEGGKDVRITTDYGTDLQLQIGAHPVHIEDGIIDEADKRRGLVFMTIPTGFVATAPLASIAEGRVFFDLAPARMGRVVKGLTWEFRGGRIIRSAADDHHEAFSKLYDDAEGDKDLIALFMIGINPEARLMGYGDWIGLGVVTIGIGENRFMGGNNTSSFHWQACLGGATVTVDGKPLVTSGKLVL